MQETETPPLTQEQVAERLLHPLFRCLDEGYKKRYVKNIWDQFGNGIRSAAYTNDLKVFVENMTRKLPIVLQAQYTEPILSVLNAGHDEQVLDWLRTEPTYLMLTCRMLNQDRKDFMKLRGEPLTSGPVTDLPEKDPALTF